MFGAQSAKGPWKGVDVDSQLIPCFSCGARSTLSVSSFENQLISYPPAHQTQVPHPPCRSHRQQQTGGAKRTRAHDAHVNKKKGTMLILPFVRTVRSLATSLHFLLSHSHSFASLFLSLSLPVPQPTLSLEQLQPQRYFQDDRRSKGRFVSALPFL